MSGSLGLFPASGVVGEMAYAAVGGMVASAASLAVLAGAAVLQDRQALVAPNAVGAWVVRWLHTADPDALDAFYYDATLGGIALSLVAGLLFGTLFGGVMARLPDDHPVAWGLILGAAAWGVTRFVVAPALDPVLLQAFDWRAMLPAHLLLGLVSGMWVQAGRALPSAIAAEGA